VRILEKAEKRLGFFKEKSSSSRRFVRLLRFARQIHDYRIIFEPALYASIIFAAWWVFWGAFWINSMVRQIPVIGWLSAIFVWVAFFASTLAVLIYAKYKEHKDKRKESWHPSKSAFEATVEAQL